MRKLRVVTILLMLLGLSGCFRNHISLNGFGEPSRLPEHRAWVHHVIAGLIPLNRVNVSRICPDGVEYVATYRGIIHIILTTITGGIYTPSGVDVYCKSGRRGQIKVDRKKLMGLLQKLKVDQPKRYKQLMADVRAYQKMKVQMASR